MLLDAEFACITYEEIIGMHLMNFRKWNKIDGVIVTVEIEDYLVGNSYL